MRHASTRTVSLAQHYCRRRGVQRRRWHGALRRRGRGMHAGRRGCGLLLCAWSLCTSVYVSLHVAGASPKSLYATLSRQKRNTVNNNKSVANVKIPGIFLYKTVVTIMKIEKKNPGIFSTGLY